MYTKHGLLVRQQGRTTWLARLLIAVLLAPVLCWPVPSPLKAQGANLLSNPGFEAGASPWSLCGNASIVDNQTAGVNASMVYAGRRALRLMDTDDGCGSAIFDPYAAATQLVSIDPGATAITVSFWYSRVGNPVWPLKVSLAEPGGFGYLAEVDVENLPGWHLFRYELPDVDVDYLRGKTVQLTLASEFSTNTSNLPVVANPGFYVDNVRLVLAAERTVESPRPAKLTSDGTRPIVYLDGALGGIARINANGSSAKLLYRGATTPFSPVWSSRGDRVVVIEESLNPENTNDINVNRAFISIIKLVSANGVARELLRTSGLPGYRPSVPSPGNPERPALDLTASYAVWSPDDRRIAVALCATNRYQSGSTSDPICWIELFDTTTGASRGKFEPGFAPSWSTTNRILYSNEDAYKPKPMGIYEVNAAANPSSEQLLVAGTGRQFYPSFYTDRSPSWAPDGSKFATVRKIDGFHRDANGAMVSHYAIMLFKRNELVGRQILLADQGSEPSYLTWSPDGTFLLYTLFLGGGANIWWLDTQTGATGRLTTNGHSAAASWRLRCPTPTCQDSVNMHLPYVRR
jgi:Tol biopolymer transport system component